LVFFNLNHNNSASSLNPQIEKIDERSKEFLRRQTEAKIKNQKKLDPIKLDLLYGLKNHQYLNVSPQYQRDVGTMGLDQHNEFSDGPRHDTL